jgi:hypothetical protein
MLGLISAMLANAVIGVNLDFLTVERARTLDGKIVVASFIVVKPTYTWSGLTILGAADHPQDEVERGAVLLGTRHDIEEGKRVTVVGRLRVIRHRADFVGGVFVPDWTEIRVER